jgi:divalent metal cation (Fe/Co/Zn/Cd) transporter
MKLSNRSKALWLSIATVGYNVIEGIAAIVVGLVTNSSALVGFGADSFIESISGSVMIWRFSKVRSSEDEERVEERAEKLVGYSFFILGAYVLYEAARQLFFGEAPDRSAFGIILATLSLVIMPFLYLAKNRLGKKMGSRSLVADSKQTLACIMLSATLFIGVSLNYFFGLGWADAAAGVIISLFIFHEGKESLE